MIISEPGIYTMPADDYHAGPVPASLGGSLSHSGSKLLLPPSCPALFKWEREHGRPDKPEFDFGHAAHTKVLGVGNPVAVIPDEMLAVNGAVSTKDAKAFIAEARAKGQVPLKSDDAAVIGAMATALREHPIAAALLDPDHGTPEQALFVQDVASGGVWLRGMLDWLPNPGRGRLLVADYKTTPSAAPARFRKSAADFGYHSQAVWYLDLLAALGISDDAAFLFIAQEKTAPYLVTVYQPDDEAMRVGRERNRRAIDLYAQCTSDDHWPGYSDEVELLSLPPWVAREHEYLGATA